MTDRELDRRAAHRLAVIRHAQEVTGNVSKTCRHYGITRQSYYKWLRRFSEVAATVCGPVIEAAPEPLSRPDAALILRRAAEDGVVAFLGRARYERTRRGLAHAMATVPAGVQTARARSRSPRPRSASSSACQLGHPRYERDRPHVVARSAGHRRIRSGDVSDCLDGHAPAE